MSSFTRVQRVCAWRGTTLIAAALAGAAVALGYTIWWRENPSACPYAQRFWLELPHPFITRTRLREALVPGPGERVLEIGPGTGYYALEAARWIKPGGTLDVFDLQQVMLDHVLRRAQEHSIINIRPTTRGDARTLPYPESTFDAAYLVALPRPGRHRRSRGLHRRVRELLPTL